MSDCRIVPDSPCSPPFPEVTRDELLTDIDGAKVMAGMYEGWAYYRPSVKGWMVWNPQNGRWLDGCQPLHQGLWDRRCQQKGVRERHRAQALRLFEFTQRKAGSTRLAATLLMRHG